MAAIVFVKQSVSTYVDGAPVRLSKDEAWDGTDRVVKARPDLFSDTPERLQTSGEPTSNDRVEQATAAPGEKRTTKRAAKSK